MKISPPQNEELVAPLRTGVDNDLLRMELLIECVGNGGLRF